MYKYRCNRKGELLGAYGRTVERKENQMEHFKSNELCISEFKRFEA